MGRIGVTLSGIERSLLNRLAEANTGATLSSLRMAAGTKILSPADDPAAFHRLSDLQAQLSVATHTTANVTAAASLVGQIQSTLGSVRTQLDTIRTELLADQDRSLSAEQREASQAAIDAALLEINRLAATEIDGRRVLDGSADFTVSGRNSSQIAEVRAHTTGGIDRTIDGSVSQAAQRAELTYTGNVGLATVVADATFTLTGATGSIEITVAVDDPLADVVTEINDNSHVTGVTASLSGDDITLSSVAYGSDATIAVEVSSGTFAATGGNGDGTAEGVDAVAEIGGVEYTGRGNRLAINAHGLRVDLELAAGFTGDLDAVTVGGQALTFALSTNTGNRSQLAVGGVQTARLGGPSGSLDALATGGSLAGLDGNTSQAIRVVDEALADLTRIEAAVDGFYNASISTASSLMSDLEEDLQSAIDDVNLVDDEEETERLAQYLDLASNSVAGLAILRQQRSGIVAMIQHIAGLR